jgi:hypothetical protein
MAITLAIGAGITGVSAIASIVRGVQQNSQAKQMERNNVRPLYKISDQIYDNVGLAENRAQGGFDQQTLNYLSNQQERGLQSSMSAILQGGGSINNIGSAYDSFLQGSKSIALEDEKIHMANIAQLFAQRETLAEEQARAWTINDYSPYKDKQLAIAQLRSDGNKNISSGINTFAQAGMMTMNGFDADKIDTKQKLPTPPEKLPTSPEKIENPQDYGYIFGVNKTNTPTDYTKIWN